MTETNRIEYKRELTSELDIEKEVVAFLNYKEGRYIYIGIDKDGSTMGVSDVELVESLGSGIPRILRAYGEDCFKFTDNFIRTTLPISAHDHASDHASHHTSFQAVKPVYCRLNYQEFLYNSIADTFNFSKM